MYIHIYLTFKHEFKTFLFAFYLYFPFYLVEIKKKSLDIMKTKNVINKSWKLRLAMQDMRFQESLTLDKYSSQDCPGKYLVRIA